MILPAQTLANRQALAKIEPAIVTARQPYLFTKDPDIGPSNECQRNYKMNYHEIDRSFLPEHKVTPTSIEAIQAVAPFPSSK